MTRTTQPTTKAERDEWRINGWGAHGFPERLLDDADQREELMQILSYEGEMHANAATLYKEQLDALRQRVAVLEEALNFYANKDNHKQVCPCKTDPRFHSPDSPCSYPDSKVMDDEGDIARAALAASPPAKPEVNEVEITMLPKVKLTAPLPDAIVDAIEREAARVDAVCRAYCALCGRETQNVESHSLEHGGTLANDPPAKPDDCCSVGGAVARVRQEDADANAYKVTCRRCGNKVDLSECVGEAADPDSEPVCYGCQFKLLIAERDRFQRLAKFYDSQIREQVTKTIVEREPDGSPCWAGKAPTLHLIRVCDEHVKFTEIVRRLVEWRESMHQHTQPITAVAEIARDAAALRAGAGGGA